MGLRLLHGIGQHLQGHLHQRILLQLPQPKKIMMIVEVILLKSSAWLLEAIPLLWKDSTHGRENSMMKWRYLFEATLLTQQAFSQFLDSLGFHVVCSVDELSFTIDWLLLFHDLEHKCLYFRSQFGTLLPIKWSFLFPIDYLGVSCCMIVKGF